MSAVLAELFAEVDEDTKAIVEHALFIPGSPEAPQENVAEIATAPEFTEQLVEYVRSLPEAPPVAHTEQPLELMEDILETAMQIQEIQKSEAATIPPETKEELEILCTKLLESLGVEPDITVVIRMVEKILTADNLAELSHKKLTIEELAKLGTHEYKLESWFNKFKQIIDDSAHSRQIVGRVALRLTGAAQ